MCLTAFNVAHRKQNLDHWGFGSLYKIAYKGINIFSITNKARVIVGEPALSVVLIYFHTIPGFGAPAMNL